MRLLDILMSPFCADLAPGVRNETSGLSEPAQWLIDWFTGGTDSDSGMKVSPERAMTYSTVWQAATVLAGDVAQLPIYVYKRTGATEADREIDFKHSAQRLINRGRPNDYMSWQDFVETMMLYALLWGNGCAEIKRDRGGRPVQLTPLLPDRTWMEEVDGRQWIVTSYGEDRSDVSKYRVIPYEDVLHIKGLSWDGLWGINVVTAARNCFGLGLAEEKYANRFFRNNARPSGVLEHPGVFKDENVLKRLKSQWEELHKGLDNTARIAILEQGTTFKPMSLTMEDSQWIDGRRFQRAEVASWFNLPPHKIGDLERATFSNIEEQNTSYLQNSLSRWLVKWQMEMHAKLLSERERETDSRFLEFITAAFLRGDIKSRFEAYKQALGGAPFMVRNEIRRMENLPAIDGGDEFIDPKNMGNQGGNPNDATGQNAIRESFRAQLQYFAGVEARRIRSEARDPAKFTDWLERFYSHGGWSSRLRSHLVAWGQADLAEEWCLESRELLELVVSSASRPELARAIDDALADWTARVDRVTNALFPRMENVTRAKMEHDGRTAGTAA